MLRLRAQWKICRMSEEGTKSVGRALVFFEKPSAVSSVSWL